ncbi:MAG: hypothetical protein K5695_14135 [Oscillospiraceae bacterium]|nr:hypothetical protein [Oscillospiraceae bacterium]
MDQSALEMMKRCYAGSREPVTLLDERWNVIWQNIPLQIGYLPKLLGVPEDSWDTCTKNIRLGVRSFTVRLLCSPEDGLRIAMLQEAPAVVLPMETDLLTNVAHSIYSLTDELHRVMDENELYDDIYLLMALRGNCMRLYRPAFLQKELERCQAGQWKKEQFSVRQQISEMQERIRQILGRSADVSCELCEEEPYMVGDIDAFQTAVLSALALTFHDREHRLGITFRLSAEDTNFTVTVSTTTTPELRSDTADSLGDFGSNYPETVLLNTFCEACGGSWIENTNGDTSTCRITLPAAQSHFSTLMSIHGRQESRFFNKYEILLAKIRLRRMG